MKILLVGATGTIGTAVTQALETRHEVLRASHSRSPLKLDLADPESIRQLYSSFPSAFSPTGIGADKGEPLKA